ncbi:MAG: glycosyl hydrolase [Acidobacteria bacterium]|nr:glycosyl hydrolase [Acidobacteriota bacterium]
MASFLWLTCLLLYGEFPQQTSTPTSAEERSASFQMRLMMEKESPFQDIAFVNAGPVEMGGRIIEVLGFSDQPYRYVVAYASGGLWESLNNGASWRPCFDQMPSITIGAFTVAPSDTQTFWVGTGEVNSSRSSYAGTGVYLSRDGGKTWEAKGLEETHHIGAIRIHPTNPQRIWVAAMGPLYSKGGQRGIFRSDDGGTTWSHVLEPEHGAGAVDLAVDPSDPDHLLACIWSRSRTAWDFQEAGPGSGLFQSRDGGTTWSQVTQGLPQHDQVGRLGVAFSPAQPNRVYLSLDNQSTSKQEKPEKEPLTAKKLRKMDKKTAMAISDKDWDRFLRKNSFHAQYDGKSIKAKLEKDEIAIQDLLDYINDGNAALFDRDVVGVELYRSDDRGLSWTRTHSEEIPDFAYSYGYYFGEVFVHPTQVDEVTITGVPLLRSHDGGKTFENINEPNVHVDHHAMWIDPQNPEHQALGNDGGLYFTYDGGAHWTAVNNVPVGQFYTVTYDMADPYSIYGGLQDNGVWRGRPGKLDPDKAPWVKIGGGDGAFVQVDFRDNSTTYLGYQFGHYTRVDAYGKRKEIFPRHELKETPYRYNWMSPIWLSRHHSDVLYMGGNRLLRSLDKGETWTAITPDLTSNPNQGDVPFGTITALCESASQFGTLLIGTDDGHVWHMSSLSGLRDISAGLQPGLWVSSAAISEKHPEVLMVTLTGYRNDDFRTYVYRSENSGETWSNMGANLPAEACNNVKMDPDNDNLVFLGTDIGIWTSLDKGKTWSSLHKDLAKVPVYALEIQPKASDLIAATHGRSVFVAAIKPLRVLAAKNLSEAHLILPEDPTFTKSWGDKTGWWDKYTDAPCYDIHYWTPASASVEFSILDENKKTLFETKQAVAKGLHAISWDFVSSQTKTAYLGENGKHYAKPGTYSLVLKLGDRTVTEKMTIKEPES